MLVENKQYCPCCKSEKHYLKYTVDVGQTALELASTTDEKIIFRLKDIIRDIWKKDYAEWLICQECGFGFANPFIACNSEYYQVTYTDQRFYTPWKWEYEIALKLLNRLVNKDSHVLEIGAGQGAFLNRISPNLVSKENILCTEFSDYGKNYINSLGIECKSENINDLVIEKNLNRFDFICLFQVFEHLDNLEETFVAFNKLSDTNCNLLIAVPSNRHRKFHYSLGEYLDFPPGHLGCYTPQSIRILANRHGWELKKNWYQPTKKRFQVFSLISHQMQKNTMANKNITNLKGSKNIRKVILFAYYIYFTLANINKITKLLFCNYGVSQFFWIKKS